MKTDHTHCSSDCKSWNYCEERVKERIERSRYVKNARESLMKKRAKPAN